MLVSATINPVTWPCQWANTVLYGVKRLRGAEQMLALRIIIKIKKKKKRKTPGQLPHCCRRACPRPGRSCRPDNGRAAIEWRVAGDNAAINPGACCGPRIITAAHRESAPSKRLRGFFRSPNCSRAHLRLYSTAPHQERRGSAGGPLTTQHFPSEPSHRISSVSFSRLIIFFLRAQKTPRWPHCTNRKKKCPHGCLLLVLTFLAVCSLPSRQTGYLPVGAAGVVAETVVSRSAYFGTSVPVVMFIADEPVWVPELRLVPALHILGPPMPDSQLSLDGKRTNQEIGVGGVWGERNKEIELGLHIY